MARHQGPLEELRHGVGLLHDARHEPAYRDVGVADRRRRLECRLGAALQRGRVYGADQRDGDSLLTLHYRRRRIGVLLYHVEAALGDGAQLPAPLPRDTRHHARRPGRCGEQRGWQRRQREHQLAQQQPVCLGANQGQSAAQAARHCAERHFGCASSHDAERSHAKQVAALRRPDRRVVFDGGTGVHRHALRDGGAPAARDAGERRDVGQL